MAQDRPPRTPDPSVPELWGCEGPDGPSPDRAGAKSEQAICQPQMPQQRMALDARGQL